jgi:hypothetical protein
MSSPPFLAQLYMSGRFMRPSSHSLPKFSLFIFFATTSSFNRLAAQEGLLLSNRVPVGA